MNTSITEFRESCERGANKYAKLPENVVVEQDLIVGLQAEWIIPEKANEQKLVLYVHGGGYVSGSCNDYRAFVAKLAEGCGLVNLLYEYRLAPEFPFPYALNDSLDVYKKVLEKGYLAENIVLVGESAGGGLALALIHAMIQRDLFLPKAVVAISPWTDLTCSSDSYLTKNKVSVAPIDSWTVFSKHYVGNANSSDPLISQLFCDLSGFPSLFINAGTDDELYDDSRLFYEKAMEARVDVEFRSGVGMIHCYPLLAPMFREATEAMDEILTFIRFHTE